MSEHHVPGESPALPMDPRIRARRIQVQRDEGRRRLRVVVAGLGTMVAAGAAYGSTRTPLFDVDAISVAGTSQLTTAEVAAATGVNRGQLLTEVDVHRAESAVEALPWVASATVEKRWPGGVTVTVSERQAVASVAVPLLDSWTPVTDPLAVDGDEVVDGVGYSDPEAGSSLDGDGLESAGQADGAGEPLGSSEADGSVGSGGVADDGDRSSLDLGSGGAGTNGARPVTGIRGASTVTEMPPNVAWAVVDREGRVLEVSEAPPRHTVVRTLVEVPAPGSIVATDTFAGVVVAAALPARLRARVSELRVAPGEQVTAVLSSGETVVVGRPTSLPDKIVALETLLAKADMRGVTIIDIRVPSAPALTRS